MSQRRDKYIAQHPDFSVGYELYSGSYDYILFDQNQEKLAFINNRYIYTYPYKTVRRVEW